MGVVYRAREIRTGRSVAIKFANRTGLPRFRREFRELKQLNHAHIVKVLDFDPDFDPPYLVMEYLNGEPLNRYYRTYPERRLPYHVGIPLFIQLTDALSYLHHNGILHRDLKPANLMVLSDQGRPYIKLMDFGLVRPRETMHNLTVRGQLLGTPPYMSPEQFDNPIGLTPQSDLYALGVIMYDVFTGQRPFEAKDTGTWREKHKTELPTRPEQLVPGLPPILSELILRLLAKNPAERPQSADVVRLALSQLTPPEKAPATTPRQPSKLASGTVLHQRYQIQNKLGEGGFGAVFKAWDTVLDVPVAIKVNQAASAESERQFKREASLLAQLRHPNLPRVMDYFVTPGGHCLVMDFIEGHNLSQVLQTAINRLKTPVPEKDVLAWADQICNALGYLHSQNPPVVHRDIKPENIIITPQKQAMLVDFGIVKASAGAHTHSGAIGVTPGFAPPEQYSQVNDHTDPRSDIYALGATLYTLLTGQVPTESISLANGFAPALSPVGQLNPLVSDSTSRAIQTALQIKKELRFQSIGEFRQALQRKSAGIAASTSLKQSVLQIPPKWAKVLGGAAIIGFGMVVLLAGILFANFLLPDTSSSTLTTRAVLTQTALAPTTVKPSDTPTEAMTPTAIFTNTPEPSITPYIESPTETPYVPPPTVEPTPFGGGGLIAFHSDKNKSNDIYLINPDSSGLRQLTFSASGEAVPAWSSDGRKIVYQVTSNTVTDIFILDLESGVSQRITNWQCEKNFGPSLSPDGSKIVFYAICDGSDNREIYVINLNDFSVQRLTNSTGSDWFASWSPDGQKITFTSKRNGKDQVFVMDGDGGNPQALVDGCSSAFSPDSSQIVFAEFCQNIDGKIFVVEANGLSDPRVVTDMLGRNPNWSPDGRSIVFESSKNIWITSVDGLYAPKLVYAGPNGSNESAPVWQPMPK